MHVPPRWPPEIPMALGGEVASPGRRILKNSAASPPGQSQCDGGPPLSRPTILLRGPPLQSLGLLGPVSQWRTRWYERSPRWRRSLFLGASLPGVRLQRSATAGCNPSGRPCWAYIAADTSKYRTTGFSSSGHCDLGLGACLCY